MVRLFNELFVLLETSCWRISYYESPPCEPPPKGSGSVQHASGVHDAQRSKNDSVVSWTTRCHEVPQSRRFLNIWTTCHVTATTMPVTQPQWIYPSRSVHLCLDCSSTILRKLDTAQIYNTCPWQAAHPAPCEEIHGGLCPGNTQETAISWRDLSVSIAYP